MMTIKEFFVGIIVFILLGSFSYALLGFIEVTYDYREWSLFSRYFFNIFLIIVGIQIPKTVKELKI